jgi:CheY-like chemotaxis protein
MKLELIKKNRSGYDLTSLGKLVYHSQTILKNGLVDHWKLKVLDNLDELVNQQLKKKFMYEMINNEDIRKILTNEENDSSPHQRNNEIVSPQSTSSVEGQSGRGTRDTLSCANIMIIENDSDILTTFEKYLMGTGHHVYTFSDPYEALKAFTLKSHYFDLVVTDIRMDGLNGIALYKIFRSLNDSINVLFVSALDAAEELMTIFPEIDRDRVVRKPIDQRQFINAINNVLGRSIVLSDRTRIRSEV